LTRRLTPVIGSPPRNHTMAEPEEILTNQLRGEKCRSFLHFTPFFTFSSPDS